MGRAREGEESGIGERSPENVSFRRRISTRIKRKEDRAK
jgi:hypothetical protein